MKVSPQLLHSQRHSIFAAIAAAALVLLGGMALVGWLLHLEALKRIIPGAPAMRPNMAAGFLLCGACLALLSRKGLTRPIRICAIAMAATVTITAALTLGEYFFGWNLPIEQWLIGGSADVSGRLHPGRVASASALGFLLAGGALWAALACLSRQSRFPLVVGLSAALVFIGTIPLAGWLLEILLGPRWNFMGMDVSGAAGAIGFTLLGGGLLALLHRTGGLAWSLNGLTTTGFVLGLFLMIFATAAVFNLSKRMLKTTTSLAHRQEVLKEVQEVMTGVATLVSQERVYVLVGDERLLKDREQTKHGIKDSLVYSRKLTADNAHQQRRLDRLEQLIRQQIEWEEQVIAFRRDQGLGPGADMVSKGLGLGQSDQISVVAHEAEAEEYQLLERDRKQAQQASATAFSLLPLGVFLSLAILSLSAFFLNAGMGERRKAEEKYRSIFENAVGGIFQTTPEGEYLSVNPALARIYGYESPADLMGTVRDIGRNVYVSPERRTEFRSLIETEGSVEGFEYEVYRKDGRRVWISENARAVKEGNGTVVCYEGTTENITERRQAEQEKHLMQTIALAIGEAEDVHAALQIVLRKVCEATGWLVGQAWIPRRDQAVMECNAGWSEDAAGVQKFRAASQDFTFARGVGLPGRVWASKKLAWIDDVTVDTNFPRAEAARAAGLKAAVGIPVMAGDEVVGVVEFFVRESRQENEHFAKLISSVIAQVGQTVQRKQAEDALRASEAHLHTVLENLNEGVVVCDLNGRLLHWNRAALKLHGYAESDQDRRTLAELADTFELSTLEGAVLPVEEWPLARILRGEKIQELELRVRRIDRDWERIFHYDGTRVRDTDEKHLMAIVTIGDVTERKRAEKMLRSSEERYRTLFESNPNPMWVYDSEKLTFLAVNTAALEHYGYTRGEFLAMSIKDIRPPEDVAIMMDDISKQAPASNNLAQWRHRKKSGAIIDVEITSHHLLWLGRPARVVLVNDITDRKRADGQLREQAEMLNRAHDAIIVRNFADERISFWSSGAERLYGWSGAEAIGRTIGDLIFAGDTERVQPLEVLMATGEFHGEVKQVAKDGRQLIVDCRATLVRNSDASPRSVLLINTDVTEHKKLETQLLRSQRLESIGTLASGVAHDLNNILTPILVCAETLRSDLDAEDRQFAISLIEESARRGASVVKQVLTFARGIEGERILIKPSHLIDEMVDIARKTFPKSIEIDSRYPEDIWTVQGDPTQLHQVLLNLSVNARDAMAGGGSLMFAADNFTADEHYAAMTPDAKPGPYVALCVTDSGMGMRRATIEKIFDPFFTTKEVGKGTGLGLSTSLGIVKSHGGFVSVYSEIGKGTTFKVFLPAILSGNDIQNVKTATFPTQGNGEQILVVDDEANILKITKMILEKHNYRVLAASDGAEALALFAPQMHSISGVLTDISMPYMDAVALTRALGRMKPDVPIIASTGQGDQPVLAELRSLGVKSFLSKPYSTEKLLTTVHDSLHGCTTKDEA